MPSIRVRRSHYGALDDLSLEPSTQYPRSLANSLGGSQPQRPRAKSTSQVDHGNNVIPEPATVPRVARSPGLSVSHRPRAASVVSQHVLNVAPNRMATNSTRDRRISAHPGSHSSARSGMIELEGDQADILVPSDTQGGAVGSALNLTRYHESQADEDEHHDEIVEHLDVIGMDQSLAWVLPTSDTRFRSRGLYCGQSRQRRERYPNVLAPPLILTSHVLTGFDADLLCPGIPASQ